VIGVDFSGGAASVAAQSQRRLQWLEPAILRRRQYAHRAGRWQRALHHPFRHATQTVGTLTGGSAQLPLFTDGGNLYTGR